MQYNCEKLETTYCHIFGSWRILRRLTGERVTDLFKKLDDPSICIAIAGPFEKAPIKRQSLEGSA